MKELDLWAKAAVDGIGDEIGCDARELHDMSGIANTK